MPRHALNAKAFVLILIACTTGNAIGQVSVVFDSKFGSFGTGDGQFVDPNEVAVRSDGAIVVSDGDGRISFFDLGHNFINAHLAPSASPFGVAFEDYAWVGNYSPGTVSQIQTISGAEIGRYVTGGNPSRTVLDNHGNVFVATRSATPYVAKISNWTPISEGDTQADLEFFTTIASDLAPFNPDSLSVAPNGDIWVTSSDHNKIRVFDSDGNHVIDSPFLGNPFDIHHDIFGNFLFSDLATDQIHIFDRSFQHLLSFNGDGVETLNDPSGIFLFENKLYIAESGDSEISVWSLSGMSVPEPATFIVWATILIGAMLRLRQRMPRH